MCFYLYSFDVYSQQLTVENMKNDLCYYFDILKNKHSNLYRKYTSEQYDSIYKSVLLNIKTPLLCVDFNRMLLRLNQYTDGHTQILSDQIWKKPYKSFFFPYVSINGDSLMLKNKIIISVNDVVFEDVVKEMKTFFSWENNLLLNEVNLNYYLPMFLLSFHKIQPPYYIALRDVYTNKQHIDTVCLNAIEMTKDMDKFQFKFYEEECIAVFNYNSSDLKSREKDFKKILPIAFKQMKDKNIKYLFINVARNGGGDGRYNDILLKYINAPRYKGVYNMKVNLNQVDSIIKKDMGYNPDEALAKYGTNIFKRILIKRKINKLDKMMSGFKKTGILTMNENISRTINGFGGKVFVIQSRMTYSAAVTLCETVKQRNIGLVVGEEAGQPIDYCGELIFDKLPNSEISVTYSKYTNWYEPRIYTKDGFLQPDILYDVYDKELSLNDYKKIIKLSKTLIP